MEKQIKDILIHNKKTYIEQTILVQKYLGYKKKPSNIFDGLSMICLNDKKYIGIHDAIKLIKTKFNARNPRVIDIHKSLGITNKKYTIEAQTLNPIINYLEKKGILCSMQHNISDRKIDLYIPQYKIAVECNENGHINYSEELIDGIELFSYYPYKKNFNINTVIEKIQSIINIKQVNEFELNILIKLSKEYTRDSIEGKYYKLVGQSLITTGFIIDFDSVLKICGFSRKSNGKAILVSDFDEEIDYVIHGDKIMLNSDCFKMFCIGAPTKEGMIIRKLYIKMETEYNKLLFDVINELKKIDK